MSTPDLSKPQPPAPQQPGPGYQQPQPAYPQQSAELQPYQPQSYQQQQLQPYSQQTFPQQPYPYAAQPYPYPPVYPAPYPYREAPPRGLSISSMVIGLVSLVFGFTFVLPAVGLGLGLVALKREPVGRGMAVTGVVLNGLFIVVWVALVLLWVFVIGGLLAGVGGAASTSISA